MIMYTTTNDNKDTNISSFTCESIVVILLYYVVYRVCMYVCISEKERERERDYVHM